MPLLLYIRKGKLKQFDKLDKLKINILIVYFFAGSTTIQVMRIDRVFNEEKSSFEIKYESASKAYDELRDIIYDDYDPFMNLLLNNKIVFFGSNFAWAFLYKDSLSDMSMKKVELLGDGEIQIEGEKIVFNLMQTLLHTIHAQMTKKNVEVKKKD